MIFEKCCRESDIGYHDGDPKDEAAPYFLEFDAKSHKEFEQYAKSACLEDGPFRIALRALKEMYSGSSSPGHHILEMAHCLDCLRCNGKKQMRDEGLDTITADVGEPQCRALTARWC